MKIQVIFYFLAATLLAGFVIGQTPVNAYAKVSSINDSTLVLSLVDEQYDTFEDGEKIVIMQMQGAGAGDTTNNPGFGSISSIGSAGLYEIATILSHTESAGLPDTIRLSAALQNTYNVSGTMQIISFSTLGGGGSFTSTGNISCKIFDGAKGGVLAFEVQGNLYLAHTISADAMGFKGGSKSLSGNNGDCDPSLYAGTFSDDKSLKGQGVFKPSAAINSGRAHAANGGGGGVLHNGGGAGGGNYMAGGNGGEGWIHCSTIQANGFGGESMDKWLSPNRIFLGGGGGGGHDNEGVGTSGANGGGIVMIRCDSIITSGSCTGIRISADGGSAAHDANDGKGGGGAGGTILLDVNHVKSNATCPLLVSANGGNGGNVTVSKQHGGGGGGGQGCIMLLCGGTEQNVALQTKNGKGGKNMSSFNPTYAQNGIGADDGGIFIGISSDTLPVVFSSFSATQDSLSMEIKWQTSYEKNVASFELQRSYLSNAWEVIGNYPGHGPGIFSGITDYAHVDNLPWDDANYYRLKVTDTLGCMLYSPIWTGNWKREEYATEVFIYPNPGLDEFYIRSNFKLEESWLKVYDARGRLVAATFTKISEKNYKIDTQPLAEGVYFVRYFTNGQKGAKRFVVMK